MRNRVGPRGGNTKDSDVSLNASVAGSLSLSLPLRVERIVGGEVWRRVLHRFACAPGTVKAGISNLD